MKSQVSCYIKLMLSNVLTKKGIIFPTLEELFATLHGIGHVIGLDSGIVIVLVPQSGMPAHI